MLELYEADGVLKLMYTTDVNVSSGTNVCHMFVLATIFLCHPYIIEYYCTLRYYGKKLLQQDVLQQTLSGLTVRD